MHYRDSSIATHHSRGMVIGVDSSHGLKFEGGSTGGIITAVGDDDHISLGIAPKGLGVMGVGSSGTNIFFSGSTTPFRGYIRHTDTAVATPNFNSTGFMVVDTTHVITGVSAATLGGTTNWFIQAMPHNLSTDCIFVGARIGSTAGDVHCRLMKISTVTVAASTATISFLVTRV